jgi:hypothetical protein
MKRNSRNKIKEIAVCYNACIAEDILPVNYRRFAVQSIKAEIFSSIIVLVL